MRSDKWEKGADQKTPGAEHGLVRDGSKAARDSALRAYLIVIDRNPAAVVEVLQR
jgi:hypothetical protein